MDKQQELELAEEYFEEGKELSKQAKYEQAIMQYEQASLLFEKWNDWEGWAKANNNRGRNLCDIGRYDKCKKLLQDTIEIVNEYLGRHHPEAASGFYNLGVCFFYLGDYDLAINYCKKSLHIRKNNFGEKHHSVAISLNGLGVYHNEIGKYESAIEFYEQALTIGKKSVVEGHSDIAMITNNLGVCYLNLGNYKLAIKHLQQALILDKKNFGDKHPIVAIKLYNIAIAHHDLGRYKMAITFHQQALDIRKKSIGEEHPLVANSLNAIGSTYSVLGDYKLSIRYRQEALAISKKKYGEEHPDVASRFYNLGIINYELGDFKMAASYHQKALAIRVKSLGEEHPDVANSFRNLASCFQELRRFKLAFRYAQKVLVIYSKKNNADHVDLARCYSCLGRCYEEFGDYELAINYHQKALVIYKKILGNDNPSNAVCFNDLGICYKGIGDYDLAIDYFNQALANRKKNNLGQTHPLIGEGYRNLGVCYYDLEDYDLATANFHKAIMILSCTLSQKNIFQNPITDTHDRGYYMLTSLVGKSASLYKTYLTQSYNPKYIQAALFNAQLAANFVIKLRQSYRTEGSKYILAYNATKVFDQAIQITLATTEAYKNENQHNELITAYQELKSLNPNHYIPKPENAKNLAFDFTEQSKAILLLSSLKDSEAKTTANIPIDLLEKEKQLKIELNYLDKSIATQEAKGAKKDEELLSKFQSQYFDYKQEYDQLIEQFEADYPEYYRLKYEVETASVEEVQRYLSKTNPPVTNHQSTNQLISYHITPETIYLFTITSNRYQIHEVAKPSNFAELLEDFQDAITLARIKNYIQCASSLFDLLLLPALEFVGSNTSKLIIIPHHELTTLTFDALIDTRKLTKEKREEITSSRDFSSLPYLVKDYDISYHYSATMLLHSVARQEQKRPKTASFVGFAPVSFDGSENVELALISNKGQTRVMRSNRAGEKALAALPSTENEVKEVFQLFEAKELDAQAFLYASANKQNLFENAVNHKYVLIATHGYAQDGSAGLSGIYLARGQEMIGGRGEEVQILENTTTQTPEHTNTQTPEYINTNYLLHTSEAYHLQLNAELVVLSSCSSGVGKLIAGEGMMAINRGFLYAGASNIIFTQFDIPDESSGELVKRLFSNILGGKDYASALRKAKLEVIRQSLKTPEDWAGYVLIGG